MLSDVHGNLAALESVRKALKREKPDVTLIAGDLVMNGPEPGATVDAIREMERELILRALEDTNQDKRRAASLLGISLKTLYNKLAKYGIQAVKSARIT